MAVDAVVIWRRATELRVLVEPDGGDVLALLHGSQLNYMPVNLSGKPGNFRMTDKPKFEWHDAKTATRTRHAR